MEGWLEWLRKVYNQALAERKTRIKYRKCDIDCCSVREEYILPAEGLPLTFSSEKKGLTEAIKQDVELARLHSQVLQEVLGRVDLAFKTLWERRLGFPRFKKVGRLRSRVFPQLKSHPIVAVGIDRSEASKSLVAWQIKIHKIGLMPIALHRPLPHGFKIKQICLLRKASGWFVLLSLPVNSSLSSPLPASPVLGIHWSRQKRWVTSDGERIARPRSLEKRQRQFQLLQRRLKRKQKGSRNAQKLHRKMARAYDAIDAAQKDYNYKITHLLCDRARTIFVPDSSANSADEGVALRHRMNAARRQFLRILAWVCWKRGVYFSQVEGWGVERMRPQCEVHVGSPNRLARQYRCPECGYQTDRQVAEESRLLDIQWRERIAVRSNS